MVIGIVDILPGPCKTRRRHRIESPFTRVLNKVQKSVQTFIFIINNINNAHYKMFSLFLYFYVVRYRPISIAI